MNNRQPFFPLGTFIFVVLVILLMGYSCRGEQLTPEFLKALNQVEASGKHSNVIDGDNGRSKGPFQVQYKYWADSKIPGSYAQCSDYDYSVRVVTAYLNRYALQAVKHHDYETLARVHNGGPNGMSRNDTVAYWKRFQKVLTNSHK